MKVAFGDAPPPGAFAYVGDGAGRIQADDDRGGVDVLMMEPSLMRPAADCTL
ncbi:MAG: hypothetical protein JZU64_15855 [Rhodoferax sp.]|nr:hypothetical protein [Rhodoferax sp.]